MKRASFISDWLLVLQEFPCTELSKIFTRPGALSEHHREIDQVLQLS